MLINYKKLINYSSLILIFSRLYNFLNFFKNSQIRILIYHHIERRHYNKFKKQLRLLKKKWNFITPKQFENHLSGVKKLRGKNILFTFDDGFKSNLIVEKKILNKFGIKAIFFVPSDFISIGSPIKAKKFIKKNILDKDIPSDFKYLRNMQYKDLRYLIKNGHTIGAHSKTHINLNKIRKKKKLNDEIIDSAKILEKKLNSRISHFAFTYGNYESIGEESLKLAFKKFDYVYSSLRGNNFSNYKKNIIKRDAIYINYTDKLTSIFLSGIVDIRYYFQLFKLNRLVNKIIK